MTAVCPTAPLVTSTGRLIRLAAPSDEPIMGSSGRHRVRAYTFHLFQPALSALGLDKRLAQYFSHELRNTAVHLRGFGAQNLVLPFLQVNLYPAHDEIDCVES